MKPRHIALLGDSIFDNSSYTGGEPDVAAHLRSMVSGEVTLLAVDGATSTDVEPQIRRVTGAMTHLVLSVGGNDALGVSHLLDAPVSSTGEALDRFGIELDAFEASHRRVMAELARRDRPLVVCTIYDGNMPPPDGTRARVALRMWNDVIARSARAVGARLIELRDVCTQPEDYANPIEPSGSGGKKIAEAIEAACR